MSQLSDSLTPLQRKNNEPVFDEAWQAQVLGIADSLVELGLLSRDEWASALGEELKNNQSTGAPDNAESYYRAVLRAVEVLLDGKKIMTEPELSDRIEEWRQAYLRTPHGQPVELHAEISKPRHQ